MNAQTKVEAATLALLREPFAPHHISKLPKPLKKDAAKGKCTECGGYHGLPAIHLDYVGHAALTDRLLDTDPQWSWEPLALDEHGLPALDRNGGLWIKLTVLGVTRLGYGHAGEKRGGDAIKEIIGDALRNAAMRFGAALDLWHKGDLHPEDEDGGEGTQQSSAVSPSPLKQQLEKSVEQGKKAPAYSALKTELRGFVHHLEGIGDWDEYCAWRDTPEFQRLISECQEKLPQLWDGGTDMPEEFVPLRRRIELLEANLAEQQTALVRAG